MIEAELRECIDDFPAVAVLGPRQCGKSTLARAFLSDRQDILPEIFSILRSVIDQNGSNGQFLLLGSSSRELIHQSSESLASRIAYRFKPKAKIGNIADRQKEAMKSGIVNNHTVKGGRMQPFFTRVFHLNWFNAQRTSLTVWGFRPAAYVYNTSLGVREIISTIHTNIHYDY